MSKYPIFLKIPLRISDFFGYLNNLIILQYVSLIACGSLIIAGILRYGIYKTSRYTSFVDGVLLHIVQPWPIILHYLVDTFSTLFLYETKKLFPTVFTHFNRTRPKSYDRDKHSKRISHENCPISVLS